MERASPAPLEGKDGAEAIGGSFHAAIMVLRAAKHLVISGCHSGRQTTRRMKDDPSRAVWICALALVPAVGCAKNVDRPATDLRTAPGYTTTRTGGPHDFDWMAGAWTSSQHRLKIRHAGSHDWDDFPGAQCVTLYLDGLVTADELFMPTKGGRGFTVRTFDVTKRQWAIFWVTEKTGKFDSGVFGGFEGDRGEFYGEDVDQGLPVVARYVWTHRDADHARWEQAFSYDGVAWETNWIADYVRADPAALCQAGRPHAAP